MKLKDLYSKKEDDDDVIEFDTENGFTIIRNYPKGTQYYKDKDKMFIKVAITNEGLFYSVDMTKPEKRGDSNHYIIIDGGKYKKKVTNFFSGAEDQVVFDESSNKIFSKSKNKSFSINEFVEILVKNHLSDKLRSKRIANKLVHFLLKIIFWLADNHYEKVRVSIDRSSRDNKNIEEKEKNTEPFFKYFYITKNIIFSILLIIFIFFIFVKIFPFFSFLKKLWIFGEFSLSNPFVFLFFFLIAFICEKLSILLNKKIKDFFIKDNNNFYYNKRKENFIEKLHEYQYKNKFKLKL